jgi:hypothetical protein
MCARIYRLGCRHLAATLAAVCVDGRVSVR